MIVRQFANPTTLNKLTNINPDNDEKKIAWPNLMVNSTESGFEKKLNETSLTLLSNTRGKVDCKIDGQPFKVCSSVFLIINPFQQLEYSIGTKEHIETTNIHFNYHFIQNLYSYFIESDISLLDNIETPENNTTPIFFNELHYKNGKISNLIKQLSLCMEAYQFEEKLSEIGVQLFLTQNECGRKLKSLKSKKKSTQKELYKRLSTAKDIIFYNYSQPLAIEEISKTVCISKYHFSRLFRDLYGMSPYQFLKIVRLEKSRELLLKDYSVEEIAHQVGYAESNSFINAFKSYTKTYPTEYRQLISKNE